MGPLRAFFGRTWVQHLVVLALSAALLLPNMGLGLYDPWETHYAEVARRIWVDGDWITLRWHADSKLGRQAGGRCPDNPDECYFFSKPVLIFWLMGLSLGALGLDQQEFDEALAQDRESAGALLERNDAAARLPLTLVGLIGIFGVWWYLRRMLGLWAGALGALVLATTPHYYLLSRQIMTDIAFVVPMMIGLLALTYRLSYPDEARPRHLYLFYALAGVATLAKGLLGFLLPGAIIFVYLLVREPTILLAPLLCWDRELLRSLRSPRQGWALLRERLAGFIELFGPRLRLLRGTVIFLSVAGPWYGAVWAINGSRWFDEFIIKHHFRRVGSGVHGQRGSFEYFIEQLGYGLWPWVALVPLALGAAWLGARRRPGDDGLRTMLITWAAVAFGLFTISTTKFHHYIFPAVPAMALLVATTLSRLLEAGRLRSVEKALLLVGAAVFAVVTPVLVTEPFRFINLFIYKYDRNWPEVESAATFLGLTGALFGLGLVALMVLRRPAKLAPALMGLGAVVGAGWGIHGLMVEMVHVTSQRDAFEAYHRLREPDDRIYQWALRWRGEVWYSFDEIHEIPQRSRSKMRQELSRPGRAFIGTISTRGLNNRLRRIFGRTVEPLNEHDDRYVMTLWSGPPEGQADSYILRQLPRRAEEVGAQLGEHVELLAYELRPRRVQREATVRVTLFFRTDARLRRDWTVFVHADHENRDRRHRLVSDHPPADGLVPTTAWRPGQIIRDEVDLETRPGQRVGTYTVFVGLFNDDGRMPVRSGPSDGNDRVELGAFRVQR